MITQSFLYNAIYFTYALVLINFIGYLIGAGIMVIGGLVEVFLGVNAAGKSLEQVTKPLTSVAGKATAPAPAAAPTAPARPATA
jgi:hypothetical protein